MGRLVVVAAVVALACAAHAGGNPDIRIYIDFDPPNYVHEISPAPYTSVGAYVCLDLVDDGVTAVAFRTNDPVADCPGVFASATWDWFFPGPLECDPPWHPEGTVVPSCECLGNEPVVVGVIELLYLGGSCCLQILDNVNYPRWVVDCSDPGQLDYYCVLVHGSVGGAECPEGDCEQVPVEDATWGTIKSLYR